MINRFPSTLQIRLVSQLSMASHGAILQLENSSGTSPTHGDGTPDPVIGSLVECHLVTPSVVTWNLSSRVQ